MGQYISSIYNTTESDINLDKYRTITELIEIIGEPIMIQMLELGYIQYSWDEIYAVIELESELIQGIYPNH